MAKKIDQNYINSLKKALKNNSKPITVADAATKSGLSFLNTKEALNFLVFDYRGNLSVTSDGELLYDFPYGFSKPWQQKEKFDELLGKAKKFGLGLLKFLVRSWITIVMVGYVVIFVLILIALTFSKNSDRDRGNSFAGSLMFHTLFRLVMDSLFWTFHPFSPLRIARDPYYDNYYRSHHMPRKKQIPFYEKVNGFFFGPEEKKDSKEEITKLALQEIRAQKGRIGMLDLMRVTGLNKEEADSFIARLMVDYDGDVTVSENGGIIYEFPELRRTALREHVSSPPPIWHKRVLLLPFTGNDSSSNMLIAGLNGFNLVMSYVAIKNSWTLEKIQYLVTMASQNIPPEFMPPAPQGTPLLLGWIPFIFSTLLFLIPATRALFRNSKRKQVAAKNGKRGLIKTILSKLGFGGIKEETLKKGWVELSNLKPDNKEFTREVIKLGGELEINENDMAVYRFRAIENELESLAKSRSHASDEEAMVGEIIFSSEK